MTGPKPRRAGGGDAFPRGARRAARAELAVAATALMLALAPSRAPAGKDAAPDPIAKLRSGHWVRIEGSIQADSTALCEELRMLTGDFLDDDWALRGLVQSTDSTKHEIVIAGIRVQVTENTGFDSPSDAFRAFRDLRAGSLLEVEGVFLKSRKFLAREIDDESDEVARRPWPASRVRIIAKVERVDARRRLVTAMGFQFQLTDRTRIRSVIE